MALSAELLLYSTGIFLLCQIVFLPAGHLAAAYLGANLSSRIQLLLAYGISLLSFSLFFAAGLWLRISIPTIQILLMSAISVLLGLWIVQKKYAALFQKDAAWFYLVWLLYFVLTLAATAFPRGDFREITAHTSMMLANLPIDNHIPYNFARYIVEHIDPNKLEVVPTWRASDRGPLGGLAAALFFILLGEKEQLPWLLTSPGLYFVCQAVVSFLNLLSLLGVWVLAVELLDRTSARYAVILTGINYFYFLNIFFSWPKFLMAYFLLCALYLWQRLGLRLWAGIFFAGAMLSHDSAAFCLAVSGLLLLYEAAKNAALATKSGQTVFLHRSREFMRTLLPMGIGFAATMAPWVLYKRFYSPPSPRLLYLHLFCDKDTSTVKSSFCEALRAYLRDNSWNEIIGTRVYNLWYPFDPYPSLIRIRDLWQSPAVLLNHFHMPVFFQFTWGAGGAAFILFLLGLYWLRKQNRLADFAPFLLVSYGSLFVCVLISGCRGNAANHVWAYAPLLLTWIVAGFAAKEGTLTALLVVFNIAFNLLVFIFFTHYHSPLQPFIHAQPAYFATQFLLLLLLLILLFIPGISRVNKSSGNNHAVETGFSKISPENTR